MGVTYNFSRIENTEEYKVNHYGLLNVLEVNYDKLYAYRKDTVVMPEMQAVQTLQKMDGLFDFGIYTRSVFMFYDYAVVPGEYCSEYVGESLHTLLFAPEPILKVVTCILDNVSIFSPENVSTQEFGQLKQLKSMLETAVENNQFIESCIDC